MQQGSLDPQLFQPGISSDGLSSAALMPTVAIHDAFCAFSTNTCTMALFLPSIESPSASSKRSPLPNCPKPTKASIGTTIGHAWAQQAPKCPTSSETCAESKTLLSLPGPPKFSEEYPGRRFLVLTYARHWEDLLTPILARENGPWFTHLSDPGAATYATN